MAARTYEAMHMYYLLCHCNHARPHVAHPANHIQWRARLFTTIMFTLYKCIINKGQRCSSSRHATTDQFVAVCRPGWVSMLRQTYFEWLVQSSLWCQSQKPRSCCAATLTPFCVQYSPSLRACTMCSFLPHSWLIATGLILDHLDMSKTSLDVRSFSGLCLPSVFTTY